MVLLWDVHKMLSFHLKGDSTKLCKALFWCSTVKVYFKAIIKLQEFHSLTLCSVQNDITMFDKILSSGSNLNPVENLSTGTMAKTKRLKEANLSAPNPSTYHRRDFWKHLSSCITAWFGNCTNSDPQDPVVDSEDSWKDRLGIPFHHRRHLHHTLHLQSH